MFRLPTVFCKTRTCISRITHRPEVQIQVVRGPTRTYKKSHEPERDTCPKPPIVCQRPRDDRLLYGALALMVLTGGFAVYAKNDPQLRDWLTINLPWFDDFIAVIYQENMTYMQFMVCATKELKEQLNHFIETCVVGKEPPKSVEGTEKPKPVPCDAPPVVEDPEEEEEEGGTLTPETSPCDELKPPLVIKDMCELEECMRDLGQTIISNYYTAKEACVYYNNVVEDVMGTFTYPKMKTLRSEMETRLDMVRKYQEKAEETERMFEQIEDEMNRAIECNVDIKKDPEKINTTKAVLQDFKDNIHVIKALFQWNNDRALAYDESWQMAEKLLDRYATENQSVYVGLNYCEPRPRLDQVNGDLDWLLHHTKRYVHKLRKDLLDEAQLITEKVDRAIDLLPGTPEQKDAKIKAAYNKKIAELNKEDSDRMTMTVQETERETKCILDKAQEKHEIDLAKAEEEKEKEVMITFTKMVAEALAKQKEEFNEILKEMSIKLKAVQDTFNERIKADRERNRSRALYDAGMALLAKCKKGDPVVQVSKEIEAIEKNRGFCDELVSSVLKAIPDDVRTKGIVPESVLRDRYVTMEDVALKVAMVEGEGSPLVVYAMSLLQYMFLFMKMSSIPQKEQEKPLEEPFEGLDTFDLLQRARYYIDQGNLAQALRYVNALKGASRGAASTWHDAAKAHLETRQAAEAVLAHAAALGLKYM